MSQYRSIDLRSVCPSVPLSYEKSREHCEFSTTGAPLVPRVPVLSLAAMLPVDGRVRIGVGSDRRQLSLVVARVLIAPVRRRKRRWPVRI